MIDTLWQDVRYGIRMLARNPGFTVVAVLTLALGIGANTAIFSVVNAVLLRPLPYPQPERIVTIWENNPKANLFHISVSAWNFLDWQKQAESFELMAGWHDYGFNLTGEGEPQRVDAPLVSPGLFEILGIEPLLGRGFLPEEAELGNNRVALLSYGFWQRRFGGELDVLGQTLLLDGEPVKIVGVMPRHFSFPDTDAELWRPLVLHPSTMHPRVYHYLDVVARLEPGVSLEAAQAEMNAIGGRLAETYPEENTNWSPQVVPLREDLVGDVRPALLLLLGATGFVLLIAAANVANLLLARASTREKEIAIRAALGAGRLRLIRQMVTEGLLLFGLGGAVGLSVALWGTELLVRMGPEDIAELAQLELRWPVLVFTAGVSLLTGLIFSLVPALQATKPDQVPGLKEGGRASSRKGSTQVLRTLVVVEVALALALLVGSGLMIRSLYELHQVDPGFDVARVLTMEMFLDRSRISTPEEFLVFQEETLAGIRRLPGVESAAFSTAVPQATGRPTVYYTTEDRPPLLPSEQPVATLYSVTPDYFRALGILLQQGRPFDQSDTHDSSKVCIVSQTLAQREFPGASPLGKFVLVEQTRYEIVGVVGDVKYGSLAVAEDPQLYLPLLQETSGMLDFFNFKVSLVVRASSEPMKLAQLVREQLWSVAPYQAVYDVTSLDQALSDNLSTPRSNALFLLLAAALAVLLAIAGIYGVISYAVSQRTHEFGIRMALGAQQRDILGLVLRQGLGLTLLGVASGFLLSLGLTRLLESFLFHVAPTDPLTFVSVALLLVAVALLASYIPARRASRVDPMVALRYQ